MDAARAARLHREAQAGRWDPLPHNSTATSPRCTCPISRWPEHRHEMVPRHVVATAEVDGRRLTARRS